jgi:hypothetical protein
MSDYQLKWKVRESVWMVQGNYLIGKGTIKNVGKKPSCDRKSV